MKIRVIRDTDSSYIGTIDAAVGMPIKDERVITKVNSKSIVVENRESSDKLLQGEASIWYTDAIKYGFDKIESCALEYEAAKRRKFTEGEWWYEQRGEFVEPHILQHPTVKAGWEFAKATTALRELALRGL